MLVEAGESLNYRVLTFGKYVANNYLQSIGVGGRAKRSPDYQQSCALDRR